jgi:hypothetical protein
MAVELPSTTRPVTLDRCRPGRVEAAPSAVPSGRDGEHYLRVRPVARLPLAAGYVFAFAFLFVVSLLSLGGRH